MFVRIKNLPTWPVNYTHESLLDEIFSDVVGGTARHSGRIPADIAEYKDRFEVIAELPGVKKEDLTIRSQNGYLQIEAERQPVTESDETRKVLHSEIGTRHYSRCFRIPDDVKAGEIAAELKEGILKLILPKEEQSLPREIQIR